MLKKILSYFFIVFGLVALWASTSRTAMQYLTDKRDGSKWWQTYPCLHGDLVSMSYLDFVKQFNPGLPPVYLKKSGYTGPKKVALTLHGDSYTWHLADSNFAGVAKFSYLNRSPAGSYYHLDTTLRNVMLIEISERFFRGYLQNTQIFDEIKDTGVIRKPTTAIPAASPQLASMFPVSIDAFFNKYINQNLQCNLFNYNFIMPMFQSKAALNYYLFNRASGDVVISDDRNYLLLNETVSRTEIASSYAPVYPSEVKHIVSVLNAIYDHYKAVGFDEVYFSVIPNPATILQPDGYNNLIPQVQGDPELRMRLIDIYSQFKNSPGLCYQHGDTHWTMAGKQMWLDAVNIVLTEENTRSDSH